MTADKKKNNLTKFYGRYFLLDFRFDYYLVIYMNVCICIELLLCISNHSTIQSSHPSIQKSIQTIYYYFACLKLLFSKVESNYK